MARLKSITYMCMEFMLGSINLHINSLLLSLGNGLIVFLFLLDKLYFGFEFQDCVITVTLLVLELSLLYYVSYMRFTYT